MKLLIKILQLLGLRSKCCGQKIVRWDVDLTAMQERSFCERCGKNAGKNI